ncbi:hypothetical protein pEaSNUABM54_00311 [Erwinia phage pEa_SNUABM_54]|nr:hypothetical protein pEaSNUABM54_00311 [Erwinia phage pEa_SNUABM_54]
MSEGITLSSGEFIPSAMIKGREAKHILYSEAVTGELDDALFVKERIHLVDDTFRNNVYLRENYKRPFFITKEGFRNHKDKKEFEDLNKVQRYTSTQIRLGRSIVRALGYGNAHLPLRQILRNQYIYGCDTTTPVLVKNWYQQQWPDAVTENSVAPLDIETDVVNGDGSKPVMISVSHGKHKAVFGVRSFYGTTQNLEEKFHKKTTVLVGDYIKKWDAEVIFAVFDTAFECIDAAFKLLHLWKPDFVSIWNIAFDLPKIIRCIQDAGKDPADVFSDPCVPAKYRHARWKPGKSQKVTASGKTMALHPAEQWHTMECFSSFYFVDAMCVYKRIRVVGGNERSYALDYILNKELGIRKLKFEEADHLSGLRWHQFLQKEYPIEYSVYNLFDTVSLEELDAKTHDLSQTISLLCGHSEYARFPSTPRRLSDDLEFFAQEHGRVFGTTSDQMGDDPLDKLVLGMNDWIVTLPSHLVIDNGLRCIKGMPNHITLIRAHVADLDVEGSYPNGELVMNLSKETTYRELSRIEGIPETVQRANGINIIGGYVNAAQFCNEIYGLPNFRELEALF